MERKAIALLIALLVPSLSIGDTTEKATLGTQSPQ
jgi:hypothetical protein